ncbi:MAG: 4-alpha-glucanotransferase [Bacteroidaceae bacterium]|nr:4-alpha-glucanotransferase [Bacteroidaceae bacterium]
MELYLNLEYRVNSGESLQLNINGKSFAMESSDGSHWSYLYTLSAQVPATYVYSYSVVKNGEVVRKEWLMIPHTLTTKPRISRYVAYDRWSDIPEDSYRYSSAFTECLTPHKGVEVKSLECSQLVMLKVRAPQLLKGQRLALVGEDTMLGNWNVTQSLPMKETAINEWTVEIDVNKLKRHFLEFKFMAISDDNQMSYFWEEGMNRCISLPEMKRGDMVTYELNQSFFAFPNIRLAGTLVPVFSLRSKDSFGVGDFGDLKKMIDWVSLTGQRVLQILPINDSTITHTWTDSYPYSSISIFALHPQYADLNALPAIRDKEVRENFEALKEELNALPQIDYERVNNAKNEYLHIIFEQEGTKAMRSAEFKKFFEEEKHWLVPYAQYSYLRDLYGTAFCSEWPDHNQWDESDRKDLSNSRTKAYKNVAYYYFLQFVLQRQMMAAHDHARAKSVILKGDIPIGVNRYGCDAWQEPRYFNMNGQAGAPPDDFAVDGQNWGFPTYNWEEMMKDDCLWWVRRFTNMQKYFDAYRIDHVLGFFRIWEIPMPEESGLKGQFSPALPMTIEEIESYGMTFHEELFLEDHRRKGVYHPMISGHLTDFYNSLPDYERRAYWNLRSDFFYKRHNQFWYDEAMKKMPKLIDATRMLVCAEDLGMVPDCVPWVMNELKILSLELQTMPKDPNVRFGHLSRNPYRSVCTISSHDMPTMRMWWDEDYNRTQLYYNTMLHRGDGAPHPLPGWLAKDIIYRHYSSPSMLCVLSIQDLMATNEELRLPDANAERINIPANPKHYWRYRMHVNIEDLIENKKFNEELKSMIQTSGRI